MDKERVLISPGVSRDIALLVAVRFGLLITALIWKHRAERAQQAACQSGSHNIESCLDIARIRALLRA